MTSEAGGTGGHPPTPPGSPNRQAGPSPGASTERGPAHTWTLGFGPPELGEDEFLQPGHPAPGCPPRWPHHTPAAPLWGNSVALSKKPQEPVNPPAATSTSVASPREEGRAHRPSASPPLAVAGPGWPVREPGGGGRGISEPDLGVWPHVGPGTAGKLPEHAPPSGAGTGCPSTRS